MHEFCVKNLYTGIGKHANTHVTGDFDSLLFPYIKECCLYNKTDKMEAIHFCIMKKIIR